MQRLYVTASRYSKNKKARYRRNGLLNLSHFPKLLLICLKGASLPTRLHLKKLYFLQPAGLAKPLEMERCHFTCAAWLHALLRHLLNNGGK